MPRLPRFVNLTPMGAEPCRCGYEHPRLHSATPAQHGQVEYTIQCPAGRRASRFYPTGSVASNAWNASATFARSFRQAAIRDTMNTAPPRSAAG